MSAFFGLNLEYKLGLHQEIFSICYAGKGGFTFNEIYSMPVHLRRYYLKQLSDVIERENKQAEDISTKKMGSPNVPNFRR
jgi:hypothetical protein